MSDNIILPVSNRWALEVVGELCITPEIARQIVAMGQPTGPATHASPLMSFANYPVKDKPSAPADDEEKVRAICKIIGNPYHKQWEAERLIRSISRGEVPGLMTTAEAQAALSAALSAEQEFHDQQQESLAKELADEKLESQSWRAKAADKGESARRLQAEVERLSKELEEANYWRHNYADSVKTVEAERDAAISRAENLQVVYDSYAKHENRAQKTIKGGLGKNYLEAALDAMDTARAAHAEASALILEVLSGRGMTWESRARTHFAKHQNKYANPPNPQDQRADAQGDPK